MTTKLTKLKLENIGGFKDFELNFHENLTVLIGRNGTGKTTILKSIALLFEMALETLLEFVNNPYSNQENRQAKKLAEAKDLIEELQTEIG